MHQVRCIQIFTNVCAPWGYLRYNYSNPQRIHG